MIKLNELLQLSDLKNTKIRFNLQFSDIWDPISFVKNKDMRTVLEGQYWNYKKYKSYRLGMTTIGFIPVDRSNDTWLLIHIGKVTKDLNVLNGVGYEYEEIAELQKYVGRVIIKWHNNSQQMVRMAIPIIDECEVYQILPNVFDDDEFPGYENVNLNFSDLKRVLQNKSWQTALSNQKGVYLLSDENNGKLYVGSAYGKKMILGRWQEYAQTGHGGNTELKKLTKEYIRDNFNYSILEIFKSTTADDIIIGRESWWKKVLMTKQYGYNDN